MFNLNRGGLPKVQLYTYFIPALLCGATENRKLPETPEVVPYRVKGLGQ